MSRSEGMVLANAYDGTYYLFSDHTIKSLQNSEEGTFSFTASYLLGRDMISTYVELDKAIPDENIADVLEIKAYEELGLDQTKEYLVKYVEREHVGEKRVFDIFVADPEILRERFDAVADRAMYIDLLIPAPLLFWSIYHKGVLAKDGVDMFIYFERQEVSVTLYRSGAYLYSRSIEYSLVQIDAHYPDAKEKENDKGHFFSTPDMEEAVPGHEAERMDPKFLEEIYIRISEVIVFAKKSFAVSEINRSYVGSAIGTIPDLNTYSERYLKISSSEMKFDLGIQSDTVITDQLMVMLAVIASEYRMGKHIGVNLTIYGRPPVLYKRAGGQMILAVSLVIAAVAVPTFYYLASARINDATNRALLSRSEKVGTEIRRYEKELKNKKSELQGLDRRLEGLVESYHKKELLFTAIYSKRVGHRQISERLYLLTNAMKSFAVDVDAISTRKNSFTLSLLGRDEEEITRLVRYISKKHDERINSIQIDTITRNANDRYFHGILKVDLK